MKSWVTSGPWAGESHRSMYRLNLGCSTGTFHQLQGGWFHPLFQQNMSLSHLSPSKLPGFPGASPMPRAGRRHPAWEAGLRWAAGLFPELPPALLGKSRYQLSAWLQLATAQPGIWPLDGYCVCQQIRPPVGSSGWQAPGWCQWHLVSPLHTLGE